MLKLYYGRENLEKDRFLFDQAGETLRRMTAARSAADSGCPGGQESCGQPPEKILLIVPDQFTLQAEQNAFAYLGVPGLIDLEVLSQSRLGYRVLGEAGGSTRLHIDQYGRHMIISRIVSELEAELKAFRGMKKSQSFIEMVNDFITEMKQNNVDPERMRDILGAVEADSLLYRKLADIRKVYDGYEKALEGKYIDTEDYMALFTSKIPHSRLVRKSQIWIYGFDSFTIKSLQMIRMLVRCAEDVNVIMMGDRQENGRDGELFELTDRILYQLSRMAAEDGVPWEERAIPESYRICARTGLDREKKDVAGGGTGGEDVKEACGGEELKKEPELLHLEREIYAWPYRPYLEKSRAVGTAAVKSAVGQEERRQAVGFCRAANLYAEVETAAARIVELTRDQGMRYRDIAVICNDLGSYGSVIKRVFHRYGIPVFLDEKRTVLHNPAIELTLSLLDIVTKGWQTQDVFRLLKTGLLWMKAEDYEELENYSIKYRIRGRRWKADFQYGQEEYGEEGLKALNGMRSQMAGPLAEFQKKFHGAGTAREKTVALYEMLVDTLALPRQLERLLAELNDREELLAAEEISQIWAVIVQLLDQIVELLGDETISDEDYVSMLQAGVAAVEIGLLPPSLDQIIVGTMQRTRRGRVQALLVIGANDGLIPADSAREDLLSETEKNQLSEKNIVICKNDDYRAGEERLAIYKNLSRPERYLWVSYSVADLDGREKKPSLIFEKMTQIFPRVVLEKDVINAADDLERIQTEPGAVPHMSEVFRRRLAGETEDIPEAWKITYNYMREREAGASASRLTPLRRGLFFTNKVKRLSDAVVNRLYKKEGMEDFILSPSRLERFGKCPFSHFIQYGLRPEERRLFEVAGREVGDVYHQCLMELSQELTLPGVPVTEGTSPWMNVTQEQCDARVDELIDCISAEYREGVLKQGNEELYRGERMKKIARSAAWAMISHIRQGIVREVYFEAGFGAEEDKPFPPIVVEAAGQRVRIEGKIDRVDVLSGADGAAGADSYVKIVDYKSGSERFDMEEARQGIRLQLMLYLEGAMGGVEQSRPAGVFYFEIAEPMVDASGFSVEELREKVSDQVRKSFKMDGLMVDDPAVVAGIAGDFSGFSDIVPVRKGPRGVSGTADGKILPPEDFDEFRGEVAGTIEKLCLQLVSGEVGIHPKKTKYQNACRFCQFKGICFFDLEFEDCIYR